MAMVALDGPLPDAVADFLDEHLGPRGRAHWRWKYPDATPERPLGAWYADQRGAVGGFIGLMRTALRERDGVELQAAWLVDWVAAGGGPGVGFGLLRRVQSMAPLALTLGGSAVARAMYAALRWSQRPIADVWTLAVTGRAIVERGPFRRHALLRGPARIAGAVADRLLRVRRPWDAGVTLAPVARFPPEWDGVWSARRAELAPCMDRGTAELNWKFTQYPDGGGYRRFLVRDATGPVGHLVLRLDDVGGRRRGRLIDLTWPASRPEVCDWLVRESVWRLQEDGADLVQCTASTPVLDAALRAARFRRTASLPLFHQRLPPDVPAPERWHLTYLDCDRAWR